MTKATETTDTTNSAHSTKADIKAVSKTARSNILAKLRAEVNGADYGKLPEEIPYHYPELSQQENLTQFITELEKNHAQVIKTTIDNMAEVIAEQLAALNIDNLLCGEQAVYPEVISQLKADVKIQTYDFSIDNNKELLFNECPAALSSSRCAIAATGSIVLWPDVNEPRSLSLVPPVHFVIVDANKIHTDFILSLIHI